MIARLLWIDSLGGLLVGVVVLGLAPWLADLYGLPLRLVRLLGAANLLYGSYSLALATRRRRPLRRIVLLAVANMGWGVVCVALFARHLGDATPLGLAVLALEAVYVGGLGATEWRFRERLTQVGA